LDDRDIRLISSLFNYNKLSGNFETNAQDARCRNESTSSAEFAQHDKAQQQQRLEGEMGNASGTANDSTDTGGEIGNVPSWQLGDDWMFLGQPWETFLSNLK